MSETEQSRTRWVVKIGSSLLTDHGKGLHHERVRAWCHDILALRDQGIDVVLVSSGAIAEGCARLGLGKRPVETNLQQAAAAVGQVGLVQAYESFFTEKGVHTAQILLTHGELEDRRRYLNARSTMQTLLSLGVVPIVNENDTIATEEICFGDNDTLGALVTNLIEADVFVILTDQDALYTADPTKNPDAERLTEVDADDERLLAMAAPTSSSGLGSGGMYTKVVAAKLASRSGAVTLLASGQEPNVLKRLANNEAIGTRFNPKQAVLSARKRWLIGQLKPKGQIHLDSGAVAKIANEGKSLLSVGAVEVSGEFQRGDLVECLSPDGRKVASGLVNYGSQDVAKILKLPTTEMLDALGYMGEPELIHRDNLVVV
ncbi:MAG: glutamate 5-kinase [Pseudomonadota bacterium]|nr:glutamate 5-kinase [Pseudomonadota bacterium]|tara:strand:- start:45469 stop:46590 length:1122 start_codon:yes stop_codon:yes gene_type:complete